MSRLDQLSMKKSKESFINEFNSFDVLHNLRKNQESFSLIQQEIFAAIETTVNEVIDEAIRGIHTEVVRFARFSSKVMFSGAGVPTGFIGGSGRT